MTGSSAAATVSTTHDMESQKSFAFISAGPDEKPPRISGEVYRYRWLRPGAVIVAFLCVMRWWSYCGNWDTIAIAPHPQRQRENEGLGEPWSNITPSQDLEWSACFNGHQCARLSVPMDWNSTIPHGPRVNLAVIKRPAKVPITDPRYGGLIWLQIGGPGSSGVDFLLRQGRTVQMIVDSPLDAFDEDYDESDPPKYFDILGFDPRGVNNTTPRLTCFPDTMAKDLWALQADAEGVLRSSDTAFMNSWVRTTALSEGCSRRIAATEDSNEKLAYHMNTSPVVADIVEVIEKHGKWREEEAERLIAKRLNGKLAPLSKAGNRLIPASAEEIEGIKERTKWQKGEEKLLYWGLSYGTIIGATFATMQPHRIERAIIDGVADTTDYYSGQWLSNLQDTDNLLDKFSEYCYKAGSSACPLYANDGAPAMKEDFIRIIDDLKANPIGVPSQGTLAPDLITYSNLKGLIGTAVYAPIQFFPILAAILSSLSHGNGTAFAALKQATPPFSTHTKHCQHAAPYSQECIVNDNKAGEISTAILCTDGNGTYGMSKDAYAAYVAELRAQSWLIGDSWARIRLGCVAWGIKPKWRFGGPFGGQTAKGMLLVGNRNDPVTPIRNAHAMAERFPGSVVLTLDAEGHCIMSSPSLCMAHHVRTYMQKSKLPDAGVVCDDNEKPFLGVTKRSEPEDEELLDQLRWTASHFEVLDKFLDGSWMVLDSWEARKPYYIGKKFERLTIVEQ